MRKLLLLFSLIACSVHAQSWGSLPVDYVINMNTSTPGTALTGAIVTAGTVESSSILGTPSIGTGFTVGQNQGLCSNLGPVTVGGTTFPAKSLNYNNIAISDENALQNVQTSFQGAASGKFVTSAAVCMYIGPASTSGSGSDWDRYGLWAGGVGEYAMLQVTQGGGCSLSPSLPTGYVCVRVEGGHPTVHSGYFYVQPQHAYWATFWWNDSTGTVDGIAAGDILLHLYTEDGTPIPCATTTGCTTLSANGAIAADIIPNQTAICTGAADGGGLNHLTIGNNESGNGSATTTYFQNAMFNYTTAPFPLFWAQTDAWTGIIAPPRGSTWTSTGVVGGIPARTSPVCASLTSTATNATINSAISSCSSSGGGVVNLAAGTYAATGFSFGSAHNVTVRGAGGSQTLLSASGANAITFNGSNCTQGTSNCTLTTWTPGGGVGGINPFSLTNQYPQGINTIILASGANLSVGNDILLDQTDPTIDYGGILVSQLDSGGTSVSPGVAGPWTSSGMSSNVARGSCHGGSPCYSQGQAVTVTSCNGNSTIGASCAGSNVVVTISPGTEMPNWGFDYVGNSLAPSAWWPTSQAQNDGVEDIGLNMSGVSGQAIQMVFAQNSWVKGVAITNGSPSNNGLIQVEVGHYIQIDSNYIFGGVIGSTGVYGIETNDCSDCLVVNNIVQGVSTPLIHNGPSSNTVEAYNYVINGFYTSSLLYSIPAVGDHGSGEGKNLREGNILNGATQDTIHGTANLETFFRNNFWGAYPSCANSTSYTGAYGTCTQNMTPMNDSVFHRFASFVGNVLGGIGPQGQYSTTSFITGGGTYAEFQYGGQTVGTADANTLGTAVVWGNADSFTGFASPRFNCSEVGGGTSFTSQPIYYQALLFNPCPLSHTLPASFAYASKPSWWPSGKPWPIIGPDVTGGNLLQCSGGSYPLAIVTSASQCTGGTSTTYANGEAYSNPAMDCYFKMGGTPNGTGGPLSFNRASCYTGGTPQAATPVPTPTAGTVPNSVTVTEGTAGAIVCYNTTGYVAISGASSCPGGSTLYTTAISVTVAETLYFWAGGTGLLDSGTATAVFTSSCVPTISPLNPVLNQGVTQQFTSNCAGTWSVTGAGTVSTSGLYTAPSTVTAQQSVAGFQLLPNNHIDNVNIASQPLLSNSAALLAQFNAIGAMAYGTAIPLNYTTNATATKQMIFLYTPANNGSYQVPACPNCFIQNGWNNASNFASTSGIDHHLFEANVQNGQFTEIYQNYAAGQNSSCATCTSQSGLTYFQNSYALPPISTTASGLQLEPLILHLQEIEAATATCTGGSTSLTGCGLIGHALGMTMNANFMAESFVWPATTNAGVSAGTLPYGTRMRLQSSFPLTGHSSLAQILLTQAQTYGFLVFDGGGSWNIPAEYAPWTAADIAAFAEFAASGESFTITNTAIASNVGTVTASNNLVAGNLVHITGVTTCTALNDASGTNDVVVSATSSQFTVAVTASNCTTGGSDTGTAFSPIVNYMQFVNESGLELSASSGEANTNRQTVTITASGGSASTDIILQGVTLNFTQDVVNVIAGNYATPIQFGYNLQGTSNTSVNWTLNPAVGSISATGAYTPPLATSTYQQITVSAASAVNTNVVAYMTINLCPQTGCRFIGSTAAGNDFTDTFGNLWHSGALLGTINQPGNLAFNTQYQSLYAGPAANKQLWWDVFYNTSTVGDSHFDIYAPPGTYNLTFNVMSFQPLNTEHVTYMLQGTNVATNVDWTSVTGGQYLPYTYSTNVTVGPSNLMQFEEFLDPTLANTTAQFSSFSLTPYVTPAPAPTMFAGIPYRIETGENK